MRKNQKPKEKKIEKEKTKKREEEQEWNVYKIIEIKEQRKKNEWENEDLLYMNSYAVKWVIFHWIKSETLQCLKSCL